MNLSGNPLDFLLAFLGGLAVSLTPCVYPLIPVSIGVIGVRAGSSKFKAFTLSLAYVSGIALVYSLLGLTAVLSGRMFGWVSSEPLTYILVGLIIIFFGISMLELVRIPSLSLVRAQFLSRQPHFSSFLLGLSSGLIISPCLTPALGSILVYLVTQKNLLYGVLLLLSFSYGMGLILILAGTFSGFLAALPKSGKWTLYLKRISAAVVIVMGLYFLSLGIGRMIF